MAVIPARGGSKGVPSKNLSRVGGLPLVGRAVAAAAAAEMITDVVVSTDDPAIGAMAERFGARVVERPSAIAGDLASSESAVLDVLERHEGELPELIVFMQCTSPFTSAEDLDGAVATAVVEAADVVVSTTPFDGFVWRPQTDGLAAVNHDASQRPRRQDRSPEVLETGAFYVMRTAGFLEHRFRFFGRVVPHMVPRERSIEIDTSADLALARALAPTVAPGASPTWADLDGVVFDFDGVLTDNRVVIGPDGESVVCDRGDGWGVARLVEGGMPLVVLSTEADPIVSARCHKLGVECRQGLGEAKLAALVGWTRERGLTLDRVAFCGNDVNDLESLAAVGWPIAVADAHPEVLAAARFVLSRPGGRGAVRELSDVLLRSRPRS